MYFIALYYPPQVLSCSSFSSSSNENYVFSLSMLQCTEASSYSNLCFQPEALPNVYSSLHLKRPWLCWLLLYYFPSFCSYRPALSFRDMKIGTQKFWGASHLLSIRMESYFLQWQSKRKINRTRNCLGQPIIASTRNLWVNRRWRSCWRRSRRGSIGL